jgi:hypothetical protein
MNLNPLAEKYKSDKRWTEHNYTLMYERMFKTLRISSLLEIGRGSGASLRMWIEYFKDARIYCMENFGEQYESACKVAGDSSRKDIEGLMMINGDSTQVETWNKTPNNLDVIIDDGNHHPQSQLDTFKLGFFHLRSGGLYFIEDTHANFSKSITGGVDQIYNKFFDLVIAQQTPEIQDANDCFPMNGDFYKHREFMTGLEKEIYSYHFYRSMIIVERA